MNDAPKLLIEWSSPWEEFVTAIRPALTRSPEKLAGEAATGLFPYRGILISWGLEILLLVAVIVLPGKLQSLNSYMPPAPAKYDVIYYTGDELPQTEDAGGAQSGRTGEAGGSEARHRSQTIKVSRGSSLSEKVVDAPKIKLPTTNLDVANLLALHPVPGPAPAEGLQRSLPVATLPQMNAVHIPEAIRERELEVIAAVSASLRCAHNQAEMLPGVLDPSRGETIAIVLPVIDCTWPNALSRNSSGITPTRLACNLPSCQRPCTATRSPTFKSASVKAALSLAW